MRVAVLGSTGYIGAAVGAELLGRARCEVILMRGVAELDRTPQPIGSGDVIVNCAGKVGGTPSQLKDANVRHARVVAEECRTRDARLIHLSSSAVFDGVLRGPIVEDTPTNARSAYGRSKAYGEEMVRRTLPEVHVMRPSKVFGGDDPRRRLTALVQHVLGGRPLPVPRRTALWANFVWVRDLAAVVTEAALSPEQGRLTHLATPAPWPVFVDALGEVLGRPVRRAPRAIELSAGAAASALARCPPLLAFRHAQRLLELWDRCEFIDGQGRFPPDSLRNGLLQLAAEPR